MSFYEIAERWHSEISKVRLDDIMNLLATGILQGHNGRCLEAGLFGWYDNVPDQANTERPARNKTAEYDDAVLWRQIVSEARQQNMESTLAKRISRPHISEETEFTDWGAIGVADTYKLLKEIASSIPLTHSNFNDSDRRRTLLEGIAIERVDFLEWCAPLNLQLKFWGNSITTEQDQQVDNKRGKDSSDVARTLRSFRKDNDIPKSKFYSIASNDVVSQIKSAIKRGTDWHQVTLCKKWVNDNPGHKLSWESLKTKVNEILFDEGIEPKGKPSKQN